MEYDVIVVGGGMAGLTATAFLAKAGLSVLLCEKESACGGLVNSFERDGFIFDGGIRATENSGALFPMLKKLGLDIEFLPNPITIGVSKNVIRITSKDDVEVYQSFLLELFPESSQEIREIILQIKKIMHYMEVQYGIDNPVFLDIKEDRDYFIKAILPWMVKYALTAPRISRLQMPVVDFLKRYTQNQSLVDIIAQHFFTNTPAFFALSYISLYLDYFYPKGGTATLPRKMVESIESNGGTIRTQTEIASIDVPKRRLKDSNGNEYQYKKLVWAADQKALYRLLAEKPAGDPRIEAAVRDRQALIIDKTGNESVLTLYLGLDIDPSVFAGISSGHFFYTPSKTGQSVAGPIPREGDRKTIQTWLEQFFALTTYEITCPVLRDPSLAPPGKTGLIISVLFDYALTRLISEQGWYEEFKALSEKLIIQNLEASIYPDFSKKILHQFSSTPLTMQQYSGNSDGAIVGWAFTNTPIPAESRLPKLLNAVRTPVPDILQAGQWTYSPAGLPISLITGKLAADQVLKEIKK